MLDNITDEFEEAVKESKKYALLERRSLGSLMLRRQEEATDMSSIGSKDQALIQTKGAEAVFFGNIFNDVDSGEVRITVTLESFDTQILLKKSQKLRPLELRESEVRQRVFREILGIPVSSARRNAAPGTAQIAGKATSNPPSQPNQQVTNSGSMQAGIVNGGLVINNGASKIDRKRISLDPALLRTYVGEYSANAYQSVTVTQEGDRLFAEGVGWPKTEMLAEAPREFFFEQADIQITVMGAGPDGQASGIIVHQKLGDTPYLRSSNGSGPNGAKRLADSSYDSLTRFLNQAHGHVAMVAGVQQSATAASGDRVMTLYHQANYDSFVKTTLDRLNANHQPVGDLMKVSQNVQTLDDIRKLRDGFKPFSDPVARYAAVNLERFVRMAEGLTAAPARANPTTSDAAMINLYRMSYSRMVDDNLAKLKEKGVDVENLTQLERSLQSLEDVERLAAGFKQLSESLSR
jgi:hypothetical protein